MITKDIDLKLKSLIEEHLEVYNYCVSADTRFVADLGIDSIDWMEFIIAVETEFQVAITDHELEQLKSYGSLLNYLELETNKN